MINPIDKILTEWAYRVHDGMPDPSDNYHLVQLEQYLNELRLPREAVKRVLEKVRKYKDNKIIGYLQHCWCFYFLVFRKRFSSKVCIFLSACSGLPISK